MISLRDQVKRVGQTNKESQNKKKTISETKKQSHNDLSQSPSRESGTNGTREPPVHTAHTAQVQNKYHDNEYDCQDDDRKNDQDIMTVLIKILENHHIDHHK